MEKIIRCSRCITPNSVPGITFNENGVCNHCLKYEKDFQGWDSIEDRRENEFRNILQKAKSLKRPYDCLVPLSGGKDSTYALYLATKVYNLKVLAITLDNGYLSNPAKENIKNALASNNADHVFYTVNRSNSAELFNVFIERSGDFCNACMRGINYAIEFSTKAFNIPLVIKGSGRRVQYISQIKGATSNTPSYFANVIKKTDVQDKFSHFTRKKYILELQKIIGGIADVFRIPRTVLMRFFPQHIGLYDYIYKPYPEILKIIKEEMNWSEGVGKIEHLDCELHDIPFYNKTLVFPDTTHNTFYYSGQIRQGIMNREEALNKEEMELLNIKPPEELFHFLQGNKMNFEDYKNYVINANRPQFEPKFQKVVRRIYHRFRKF